MRVKDKKNNDYVVLFKGAKLSRIEANRVGFSAAFGLICLLITFLIFPTSSKLMVLAASLLFSILGYFGVAVRVFRHKKIRRKNLDRKMLHRFRTYHLNSS